MLRLDLTAITLNTLLNTSTQSNAINRALSEEGLVQDLKSLPAFSLYELFETILSDQSISKAQIHKKLISLLDYLNQKTTNSPKTQLPSLLVSKDQKTYDFHNPNENLFDNRTITLFAYAFNFRIEMITETQGRLTTQYFGFKNNYVRRVLMTNDSYILLKKRSKGLLRLVNRSASRTLCSDASTKINTTIEDACNVDELKIKRDDSVNTADSINRNKEESQRQYNRLMSPKVSSVSHESDENGKQDHKISLNCSRSSKDPKPFTVTPKSNNSTKSTGRLKFYNEAKEYGFIVMDDQTEIFVHKADLDKQNIDTRFLAYYKRYYDIVMEFNVQEYKGKGKANRKAVDLVICEMVAVC